MDLGYIERTSENTRSQEELEKKDTLTLVYNYEYLQEYLKNGKTKSAMLFNINDFKLINNYYSYDHGSDLLFQLAHIFIIESQKYNCKVFRVSSDEFLLLYNEYTECNQIRRDIEKIFDVIEKVKMNIINVKDMNISIRASYTCSESRLLEELEVALEYAKKNGYKFVDYGECKVFDRNVNNIVEVKKILKNAITNSLVVPVYQPILMLNDNTIKYEVLMRIQEDENTLLTPDKFLEIAKEHNYYNTISEMLIFKALDYFSSSDKTFSINISFLDMKNHEFVDRLEKKIIECNVRNRIIFEIIESDILDDILIFDLFIKRFKELGVQIAIDDFGSGYSNFAHIFKLNPDYLKLDGSLITNIITDEKIHILVKTVIELAHKLDIKVIAEYVSTKELYDALSILDVDAMQGYYIGYPDKSIN
jgi:EAL domain-containing protein (putative c-di-GMP-specific phosphodiesterase class I)